jgi:SAM-dependent methyltransferase
VTFKDHFSAHAAAYAAARPTYPRALFARLAAAAPGRALAWDAGTGNGQAAVALAAHFARVHATDASAPQVANAAPHPRVAYAVAPAEASGLPDASCDLVTVAQALHWFDLPRFWAEARRVLRPGGVFAAWSYARLHATGRVGAVVDALDAEVGPWWPPERAMVDDAYASIALPFAPLAVEAPPMRARWTRGALLAYLRTWSAVRRCQADTGRDPVAAVEGPLAEAWGRAERRTVTWPLTVRAGRAG